MKKQFEKAPATDVKNYFGDYLGKVTHGGKAVLIEKHGKPVAVLVSYESWTGRQEEKSNSDPWFLTHKSITEKIARDNVKPLKLSADALVRNIREDET